jgi:hypothetical protein
MNVMTATREKKSKIEKSERPTNKNPGLTHSSTHSLILPGKHLHFHLRSRFLGSSTKRKLSYTSVCGMLHLHIDYCQKVKEQQLTFIALRHNKRELPNSNFSGLET